MLLLFCAYVCVQVPTRTQWRIRGVRAAGARSIRSLTWLELSPQKTGNAPGASHMSMFLLTGEARPLPTGTTAFSMGFPHSPAPPSVSPASVRSLPGYYAVYKDNELQCQSVDAGYFSLGGYAAQQIACPPFTSTNPSDGLAIDLTHCLCKPGYSPATDKALKDPSSPASQLKSWLLLNPAFQGLNDSQICMLCGRKRYKGRVSAEDCIDCPLNSFSNADGPTHKSSCNMCIPGYYLTSNEDIPCGECQAGFFCVGSDPRVSGLEAFAGEKIACSENTITIAPYNENADPFSCM